MMAEHDTLFKQIVRSRMKTRSKEYLLHASDFNRCRFLYSPIVLY